MKRIAFLLQQLRRVLLCFRQNLRLGLRDFDDSAFLESMGSVVLDVQRPVSSFLRVEQRGFGVVVHELGPRFVGRAVVVYGEEVLLFDVDGLVDFFDVGFGDENVLQVDLVVGREGLLALRFDQFVRW